jgi:hypothetical protein
MDIGYNIALRDTAAHLSEPESRAFPSPRVESEQTEGPFTIWANDGVGQWIAHWGIDQGAKRKSFERLG